MIKVMQRICSYTQQNNFSEKFSNIIGSKDVYCFSETFPQIVEILYFQRFSNDSAFVIYEDIGKVSKIGDNSEVL